MIDELADRAGSAARAEATRVVAALERPTWLDHDPSTPDFAHEARPARRDHLAGNSESVITVDLDEPRASLTHRPRRRLLAAAAVVLVAGVITFAAATGRNQPTSNTNTNAATTMLSLHHGDRVLQPTRTVLSLDGYLTDRFAVGPDGTIVIATDPATSANNTISLTAVTPSGATSQTGITLPADGRFVFGPGGDLFTESTLTTPDGKSSFTSVRYTPNSQGPWVRVMSATGGLLNSTCDFIATPASVGCAPGIGIVFDPPIEFDRVTADAAIAAIQRVGGPVRASWFTTIDLDQDVSCASPTCSRMFAPGPGRSAIWFPDLTDPPYAHAVFVLDERATAGSAWLPPDITTVVGVNGTDLIAVQTSQGTAHLVAIDLTPITNK